MNEPTIEIKKMSFIDGWLFIRKMRKLENSNWHSDQVQGRLMREALKEIGDDK